jgi:plasmid segregation protein ParM
MLFSKKEIDKPMNDKVLCVIDAGKFETKAIAKYSTGEIKRLKYRTKIMDNTNEYDVVGNSYKVEYEGKKYIIGEQGEEVSYEVSKNNDTHIISLYTAISQFIQFNGQTVQLAFGIPTGVYTKKENREAYKSNILRNNGKIYIKVNGIEYNFIIENCLTLPEGAGIVYLRPELFKNKRVSVIDLGGMNMGYSIYNSLVPEVNTFFNVNYGGFHLEAELMKELNTRFNVDLDEKDLQYIIQQGYLRLNGQVQKESIKIIDAAIDRFIVRIIQESKKYGNDISLMDVVMVGGTSTILEKKIKDYIPHITLVNNAQWTNAEGFLKVAELKYGNKN